MKSSYQSTDLDVAGTLRPTTVLVQEEWMIGKEMIHNVR